jgi:hypothetical protein
MWVTNFHTHIKQPARLVSDLTNQIKQKFSSESNSCSTSKNVQHFIDTGRWASCSQNNRISPHCVLAQAVHDLSTYLIMTYFIFGIKFNSSFC